VGLERALLYLVSCPHLLFGFMIISTGTLHDVSRTLAQERPHFVAGLNAITPFNGMTGSKERLSEVWVLWVRRNVWVLRHKIMSGCYVTKCLGTTSQSNVWALRHKVMIGYCTKIWALHHKVMSGHYVTLLCLGTTSQSNVWVLRHKVMPRYYVTK